jgi:hypothetical protein
MKDGSFKKGTMKQDSFLTTRSKVKGMAAFGMLITSLQISFNMSN